MEVTAATGTATGSRTIANLIPQAAATHAEHTAIRYKRDGAWHDVSYSQLADIVQEIGLGLIDLGIQPGERVCILANTRPEWSYADMAATSAGAVVVPIYQTNSPEECLWVISDSDACTFIYTSGTTGPPKGCVLSHGNYRAIVDMVKDVGEIQGDEVTYLYLPLAHSYALLIQLAAFDLGSTLAYFGGDTKQIVPELQEVQPTYLPSVPRVFEKIYTLAHGAIEAQPPEEQERARAAVELGVKLRDMMARGETVPAEMQKQFDEADEKLFKNVRAI